MQYRYAKFIATRYLQSAGELNVTEGKKLKATASEISQKQKLYVLKNACFWFYASASLVFLAS
jgi:hypothetical protein